MQLLQRDAVSETFELGDEVPGEAGRVECATATIAWLWPWRRLMRSYCAQVGVLAARDGRLSGVDQRGGRANGALADPAGSFAG
jgi:hypothetical protein